jgi:tripartite motif-containing protein 71
VVNGGGVLPARIEKFDSNGTFLTSWPLADFAPGEPVDPGYIASDPAGDVYIAESGYASSGTVTDSRIEKFDSSGNLLTSWGSLGSGPGQFDAPWGVATDAAGDVYVVDSRNYRVEEFDSSGNFIRQWGSRGKTNGQFEGPEGVATDNAGHVLVSDDGGHGVESSVQVFTANGQFLSKFYPRDFPTGVATDSAGDVFVASCCIDHSHRIQMFAPMHRSSVAGSRSRSAEARSSNH